MLGISRTTVYRYLEKNV
ncbi:helix-turn-helix domain-containing protein [Laceyella putida]|uniref:Helix-turn-helix domain-containing protein n=1 Tax=Laceyella putida TaxID=110101 RepID=A0ABW2RKZ4_9BACL